MAEKAVAVKVVAAKVVPRVVVTRVRRGTRLVVAGRMGLGNEGDGL